MNMNILGIDVPKRKNAVTVLCLGKKVVVKPFDVSHSSAISNLSRSLSGSWMTSSALLWSVLVAIMKR